MEFVRIGDTVAIGPFYATLSDGTVINLTGATIEASLATARGATPALTRQNTAAGGSDAEITVTDAAQGIFYVYLTSANTAGLAPDTTYYMDARVKTTNGAVYTVGEAEFRTIQPYTPVPTP